MPGSRRSRGKRSVDFGLSLVGAALAALSCAPAPAQSLTSYQVEGDAIAASLTGHAGDPASGRRIVTTRQVGLCLLCHSGPFPEERFQGTIGPDLRGVGARLGEGQLRLRLVDPARLNPDTIMPSYYRLDGLSRVGAAWRGRTILSAGQIEDVVAFLTSLREP